MFRVPKEIISYNLTSKTNNFLILLSVTQGWGLVKIKSNCIFLKKKMPIKLNSQRNSIQSEEMMLTNFIFGLYRCFSQNIKFQGMGYKSSFLQSILILKLGYSHRLLLKIPKNIKLVYVSRQVVKFKSRTVSSIKNLVYNLQNLRKANAYKKKGLFLKGSIIKIKQSSKKSKF